MNDLTIEITDGRTSFKPGETITGRVVWMLNESSEVLRTSLLWFTLGRGTGDAELLNQVELQHPGKSGEQPFEFRLPLSPYSFSGSLIYLTWAVEAVMEEPEVVARMEIVVSPTGNEIKLGSENAGP